jgi:hypothetical protein
MVILRVSAHGGRRNRRMVFTEIRLIAITENGNSIAENWHRDRSRAPVTLGSSFVSAR